MTRKENDQPFIKRFLVYQKERFPFVAHGLLVTAFSFSAIAYSRICRNAPGFISWPAFLTAVFTTITLFFLVRIFDEFKDAHEDALYRKQLPVPRGLVSLKELMIVGIITAVAQIGLNLLFFPSILLLYLAVIFYLCLMGREFFIPRWLRKHQFWYVVSHMLIIPLVDILASGYDWFLEKQEPSPGLYWFFAVSFMNGIVLETGRKIKTPADEAEGVLTYSSMLGPVRASLLWILALLATALLSTCAGAYAGHGNLFYIVLTVTFVLCALPAVLFVRTYSARHARYIEYASALWTIIMYLSLGGIPKLTELLA